MKEITQVAAAVSSAALLVLGFATSASASTGGDYPGPSATPDRTIHINHPAPRPAREHIISAGGSGEAFVAKNTAFPLIPSPGETVRIIYTDAVSDVTTEETNDANRLASCTRSITVGTPYKASNRPRVEGSGMISSGCSNGATLYVSLYDNVWERADGSVNVLNNGSTWGVGIVGNPCWGSSSTPYHGFAQFGGSGGTWGPTTHLTCSY